MLRTSETVYHEIQKLKEYRHTLNCRAGHLILNEDIPEKIKQHKYPQLLEEQALVEEAMRHLEGELAYLRAMENMESEPEGM